MAKKGLNAIKAAKVKANRDILHNNATGSYIHSLSNIGDNKSKDILHNNAAHGVFNVGTRTGGSRDILHNNACNACGYSNFLGIGDKIPFVGKVGLTIAGIFLAALVIKKVM